MNFIVLVTVVFSWIGTALGATNVTFVSGSTAILPCSVQNLGDHKVVWTSYKGLLLTLEDRRIIDDQRISVERPFTQDWNLHIRQVRLSDSGQYTCQVNTQPVTTTGITLNVLEPPMFLGNAYDQTVREGETVELRCPVGGVPLPSVTWYRINKQGSKAPEEVGGVGDFLKIHNISRDNAADYECVADNGVEPSDKRIMTVTVQFGPEVTLLGSTIAQAKGKETILECIITACPHMQGYWKFRGQKLVNNKKHHIETYHDDRYTITVYLRIEDLRDEDFGEYQCYAENVYGSDEKTVLLYEYIKQRDPYNTTTTQQPTQPEDRDTKPPQHSTSNVNDSVYSTPALNTSNYNNGSQATSGGRSVGATILLTPTVALLLLTISSVL